MDALGSARGADGEHDASRRFKAELLQQASGSLPLTEAASCVVPREQQHGAHTSLSSEALRLLPLATPQLDGLASGRGVMLLAATNCP